MPNSVSWEIMVVDIFVVIFVDLSYECIVVELYQKPFGQSE